MKINGDKTAVQLDAYLKKVQSNKVQAYEKQDQEASKVSVDQVELSGKAKAMQQAAQALNQTEGKIAKRVEQVKLEVDKGTYKVDSAKVATDMLKESFANNAAFGKIDMRI